MAINNTVQLTGFTGAEVKIIEKEGSKTFAAFSLATRDSYKDKETEEWKDKETIWHEIVAFSPKVIEQLKSLDKGALLEISGSLSYREFKVLDEGKQITKKEARVIANKVTELPYDKES